MKKLLSALAALVTISLVSCSIVDTNDNPSLDAAASRAAATGTVKLTILGDSFENGTLKSSALNEVGIFEGYFGAGKNLGYTDASGKACVTLPAGDSVYVTLFKMTSSHSSLFAERYLKVAAGSTTKETVHVCPTQVSVIAHYRVPYGKALYLTGQSDWLGNWKTAYKMSYREINGDSQWQLQRNLPLGAQFKVVIADWVDGESRSTDGVSYMEGNNAVIAPLQYSYESVNELWPRFNLP